MKTAAAAAASALGEFRDWVAGSVGSWRPAQPIGRDVLQWFLTEVALLPLTPEEILARGRVELDRAIALELLELNRNRDGGGPEPVRQLDPAAQSSAEQAAELAVRRFYVESAAFSGSPTPWATTGTCHCPTTWPRCAG